MSPGAIRERLEALYAPCVLCEHRCGAMRPDGEQGACGLADEVVVYNRMLHMGEERELVPSYAMFTSGCSMLCSFCSEFEHLRPPFGRGGTEAGELAAKVASHLGQLAQQGIAAKNLNFVGGEPSIVLPWIASFVEALDELMEERPPILLNTNGYMTAEVLALATHLADIFVVDLKFGDDRCAEEIGDVPRYTEVLHRNLALLARSASGVGEGGLRAGVALWVRHLLMPDHLSCCTAPSLSWLAAHAPVARVNVMPAFFPFSGGSNTRWRDLSAEEREEGRLLLDASGLVEGWFDGRRSGS